MGCIHVIECYQKEQKDNVNMCTAANIYKHVFLELNESKNVFTKILCPKIVLAILASYRGSRQYYALIFSIERGCSIVCKNYS